MPTRPPGRPFKFPRCHLKPCLNRYLIPVEPSGEIIKGGSHKPRIMPRLGCLHARERANASVSCFVHSFLSVATRAFLRYLIKTISRNDAIPLLRGCNFSNVYIRLRPLLNSCEKIYQVLFRILADKSVTREYCS